MIFADNAATTQLDFEAFEAMKPFLLNEYGNASQPYSFAREPKKAIKNARQIIASLINASPEEIYFTSGGTESDNWAIKSVAGSIQEKKSIITSAIEHHAVLNSCKAVERSGNPVIYLKPDHQGVITPHILESSITDNTKLVSIMFANNEIGTIEPLYELAQISHEHGALFHTDAVQAVGHVRINVKELKVDMLSASAHKFNGPKGVGFLYVRKGTDIQPFNDGGSQEFGMRAGTENVAGIVGMAVALRNNIATIDENTNHLLKLEKLLIEGIKDYDCIRNGSVNHIPGNVSLSFKNSDGEMLLHRLDLAGVMVSTGSACNSGQTGISHVLKAICLDESYATGTIRISFGKNNSESDVEHVIASLRKILSE